MFSGPSDHGFLGCFTPCLLVLTFITKYCNFIAANKLYATTIKHILYSTLKFYVTPSSEGNNSHLKGPTLKT